MTLIKSLLLGSAAGLVAVASAQAADLPTRKGPVAVDYVRVCSITVAGTPVVGWVLPGSDTCLKVSGYITGQVEGGNLKTGYHVGSSSSPNYGGQVNQYGGYQYINPNGGEGRDSFGYTTRFNLTFDAVSNTAYGPLVAHGEYQFNHGGGFDNAGTGGSDGGLNRAYVTWAGLTAGKIDSFFSFTGGGLAWLNFFSPDRKGYDLPDVLAYTASFGGGFSATISVENPYNGGANGVALGTDGSSMPPGGVGSYMYFLGSATEQGMRIPDVVGSLDVKQAWGTAHLAGVLHNVRGDGYYYGSSSSESASGSGYASLDKFGWAVDAGVTFNIPNLPGSLIGITGAYSQNATRYGGLPDAMNGEVGQQVNGNGQGMALADAFLNGDGSWATPTSWSVSAWAAFQVTPQVNLGIEGSYGENSWSGKTAFSGLYDSKAWLIGGVAHYDPVKNLDFEFELLYENVDNSTPAGYLPGDGVNTTSSWQGKADGFQARMEVTRNF